MKDDIVHMLQKMPPGERQRLSKLLTPRMVDQYMPHTPHTPQQLFLLLNTEEALFGGAAGGGKLILVDANVLTPWGWKRNGDLKDGDMVVNPRDGGMARITKAWPEQTLESWTVTFDDGTSIECGEDHLWTVKRAGTRNKTHDRLRANGYDDDWLGGYRVITTAMLRDQVDYWKQQKARGIRSNAPMIPVARATEFTITSRNAKTRWPLDPYLLGLFIGDGHCPSLTITTADAEIVETLTEIVTNLGGGVSKDGRYGYRITGKIGVRSALRSLGLEPCRSWEKFIPESYLLSPLDTRIQLMRGLMDTDGYVDDRGHMSYTTVSERLAHDVTTLARSMGAFVTTTTKTPSFTHKGKKKKGRLAYTVWIKPHDPSMFVWLDRKLDRAIEQQNQPVRRVVDVQPTGRMEKMRCITVDTVDGLYITDDFIVTHNSDALLMAALQYVDVPGYSALLLRKTWPDLNEPGAIMDRARSWLAGTDAVPRDGGRKWVFPSGARLSFGYIQHDKDKFKLQCFATGTELLTDQGWVRVEDIKVGDNVASVNPANTLMEYHPVTKTFAYDHQGRMEYISQQNGVAYCVTPNHTVWASTEKEYVAHGTQTLREYRADQLPYTASIPQVFQYTGGQVPDLPIFAAGTRGTDITFDSAEAWAKFLGWYVAEGNTGSYGGRWEVKITQTKPEGRADFERVLAGVNANVHSNDASYCINNRNLSEWLIENTGHGAYNKHLPNEVWGWDRTHAEWLLEALVAGDGSRMSETWMRYYTYSRQLADDVMRLAVHAGWRPTLDIRDGGSYKDGTITYIIGLVKKDRHTATMGQQTPIDYDGQVHCVEVQPHHTLVMRYEGRVSMTGNSAEYQFIGWDELTHWNESTYTYLFSRLRRPKITCRNCNTAITKEQGGWEHADMLSACDSVYPNQQAMEQYPAAPDGTTIFDIPLRMRAASNPGGVGHQWCRERFVDPKTRLDHVIFIPARLRDNPSLDQDSYIKNLQHLSPLDRERLLNGDWNVSQEGMIFRREWFRRVDEIPRKTKWVRTWDLAATKDGGDWTAGALVGRTPDGMWIIADVTRIQGSPAEVERLISATAESDGTKVPIRMEQEPGSSGVNTISHYRRNVLPGYDFDGIRPTGGKIVRANPLASAAEAGNVSIVPGSWNPVFLEEISMFPEGQHDDQTDAVTMAHGYLAFHKRSRLLV